MIRRGATPPADAPASVGSPAKVLDVLSQSTFISYKGLRAVSTL